jgi:hypothetical protein
MRDRIFLVEKGVWEAKATVHNRSNVWWRCWSAALCRATGYTKAPREWELQRSLLTVPSNQTDFTLVEFNYISTKDFLGQVGRVWNSGFRKKKKEKKKKHYTTQRPNLSLRSESGEDEEKTVANRKRNFCLGRTGTDIYT